MFELIKFIIYLSVYLGLVATVFYVLSFLSYKKRERLFFSEESLPSVSVLIPAYNEEKSIEKTIQSILNTDYPKEKFEIIVIDNNSNDKTFELAKKYNVKGVKIYKEKRRGKGNALNLGISKSKGEIIFTMDADTFVDPQSVRNMVQYFTDKKVAAVTPTMMVYNPRGIFQRIQSMEYLLGIFLRKAFATLGAVYITPGAFSAYRKKFFEKYGGYDPSNITEDIEMSLRIQYRGYFIDNSPDAPAYTIAPSTFKSLLIQRRRWYFGYIRNIWKYRELISKKYGDLGIFIIPIGLISTFLAIFITVYLFFKTLLRISDELQSLQSINYDFGNFLNFNYFFFERIFFLLFTNPAFLSIIFFIMIMGGYLYWTRRRVGKISSLPLDLFLFFVFFAILFGFWWTVSVAYAFFTKNVKW